MEETTGRSATDAPPRWWVRASFLTSGRAVGLLTAGTGLVVLLGAAGVAPGVFAVASMVALLPLPFYLALVLWLDRFEPEPRALLATAFLWGASVAILTAGIFNAMADVVFGSVWGTVVTGPLFEEIVKAVILVRFFRRRPDEFDGITDGVVYASMVGLGFACVENIEYYARSLAREGMGGLAVTFTLRGVMSPFSHPLFSAMVGIGLGLARQTPRLWVRRVAPPAGLVGAVVLHALWNASTLMGCVFLAVYLLVMLPALATVLIVAAVALRREGRLIREHLAGEVAAGQVTAEELERCCSVRRRVAVAWKARAPGDRAAQLTQRRRQRTIAELAFLRHRVARGTQPADPELEASFLAALGIPPPEPEGVGTPD